SIAACSPAAQISPAPLASNARGGAASAAPASAKSASASSPSPSSDLPAVVEPSMAVEPALKVAWERGGPAPSKPCSYSPSMDAKGRIWVAVCWDSKFWIFSPDGKFLEAWGSHGSEAGQFDFA